MLKLAVIDYGAGNVRSVSRAVAAAADRAQRAVDLRVTDDPDWIAAADRIVLPGVGHFHDCRTNLVERPGVLDAMREAIFTRGAPFLGVCVGMQLMADVGREDGDTPGLGWIPGEVRRLTPANAVLPIPHIGWNTLVDVSPHPVLEGLRDGVHVYFVHSYAYAGAPPDRVVSRCDYGGPFIAAVARDNLIGVQFHPEKSQAAGLRLLGNFLAWSP